MPLTAEVCSLTQAAASPRYSPTSSIY